MHPERPRRPGTGRYARLEREQRWIVGDPPAFDDQGVRIVDRYVVGTRLRLRRIASPSGDVFKLGQKIRVDARDPQRVMLTNVYLDRGEYDVLAALPAHELVKVRHRLVESGVTFAIDVFAGDLEGLVLVETELDDAPDRVPAPSFAVAEVSHDDQWSGGSLAVLDAHRRRDAVVAARVLAESSGSSRGIGRPRSGPTVRIRPGGPEGRSRG